MILTLYFCCNIKEKEITKFPDALQLKIFCLLSIDFLTNVCFTDTVQSSKSHQLARLNFICRSRLKVYVCSEIRFLSKTHMLQLVQDKETGKLSSKWIF